jgi:hypothetical protein
VFALILIFSEFADGSVIASRSGFRSSGAAFESAMALRVPVSVWFLPNGDYIAGRRRP